MSSKHDKQLTKIVNQPHIIGLENLVLIAKEVKLLHGRDMVAEPDVMACDHYGQWTICEYKSTNTHPGKAKNQLYNALRHLRSNHIIDDASLLYIHGEMEKVKIR